MDITNIVDRPIVLKLNREWKPVGYCSPKDAIIKLTSENEEASLAMKVEWDFIFDGDDKIIPDYSEPIEIVPLTWERWIQLPVEDHHLVIRTAKKKIRCPTVIIHKHFNRMPLKKKRFTKKAVYERDNGICQYSGQLVSPTQATIDHIVARSRGGKTIWENVVTCHPEINAKKGNKTLAEAGLKLLKRPEAPAAIPLYKFIKNSHGIPDWTPFLIDKKAP